MRGKRGKKLPWGVVQIVAGRLKGRLAFYDDDGEGGLAVVYPEGEYPSVGRYFLVRPSSMRRASPAQVVRYWSSLRE
jgi:hypothetical protein